MKILVTLFYVALSLAVTRAYAHGPCAGGLHGELSVATLANAVKGLYEANLQFFETGTEVPKVFESGKLVPGNLFLNSDDAATEFAINPAAEVIYFEKKSQFIARMSQFEYWDYDPNGFEKFARSWGAHRVAVTRVREGLPRIELIISQPEKERYAQAPPVVRLGDWFFLVEFAGRLRLRPTYAVRIGADGKVLEKKDKLDFLLDQYPGEQVTLTRTMGLAEKDLWENPQTAGATFGSEGMQELLKDAFGDIPEAKAKHMSLAAGSYWNDSTEWWEANVELKIAKEDIRRWVRSGKAFITPLGYDFERQSRVWVDSEVVVPFELASIDPEVNKALHRAYLKFKEDPSLEIYKAKASERLRSRYPLYLFEYEFILVSPFQSFMRQEDPKIWKKDDYNAKKLRRWFKEIQRMGDGIAKDQAILSFVDTFIKDADRALAAGKDFGPRFPPELEKLRGWYAKQKQL